MDLITALRSTGSVREFTDEPVGDDVVERLLESARFAPNGGNRQAWRVLVLRDPVVRSAMQELYVEPWSEYFAQTVAGITPWSPLGDHDLEQAIVSSARSSDAHGDIVRERSRSTWNAPVQLAVFADLSRLVATDRDLDHYTMIAGASIYPFVWNILLAGRSEGLGGVITTMHARVEPQVRDLLGVPEAYSLACVLALGHPVHQPTRLRRQPVRSFATIDRFDGPALGE